MAGKTRGDVWDEKADGIAKDLTSSRAQQDFFRPAIAAALRSAASEGRREAYLHAAENVDTEAAGIWCRAAARACGERGEP